MADTNPQGPSVGRDQPKTGVVATTLIVVLGVFMAVLDTSILNVALPKLMVLFGVDTKQIEWILTAYMLVSGAVIPITSYLGNRFGYKRIYIWSVASFTVGSLLCGIAWNNPSLIFFRIIQGIGGGLIMPVGTALMFRFIPKEKMGMAMGIFGLSIAAAPSIGPTLGGIIVEDYSWRLLFIINIPVGILSLALSEMFLPETPISRTKHFDFWGLVLSSGSAFLFLLGLSEGQNWGWTSYPIVMLFLTATVMAAMLIVIEMNHPEPMLDFRVFRNKQFTLSLTMASFMYIALLGAVLLLPIYLQNIRGYSAIDTGLLLMPQALAMGVMMPVAGKLYDKIGVKPLVSVGIPLIVYSTYALHTLSVDTPESTLQWFLIIRGVGMGLTFMPMNTSGLSAVPPAQQGGASAMNTLVRSIAGSFGIALTTTLLDNRMFFHQHRLSEGLDAFSASWSQVQGAAGGILGTLGDTSLLQGTALSLMHSQVLMNATTWAIGDIFLVYAVGILAVMPLGFLLKKPESKGGPAAAE